MFVPVELRELAWKGGDMGMEIEVAVCLLHRLRQPLAGVGKPHGERGELFHHAETERAIKCLGQRSPVRQAVFHRLSDGRCVQ